MLFWAKNKIGSNKIYFRQFNSKKYLHEPERETEQKKHPDNEKFMSVLQTDTTKYKSDLLTKYILYSKRFQFQGFLLETYH